MTELIRLATQVSPRVVAQEDIHKIGLPTHPQNTQSVHFHTWKSICERQDHALLMGSFKKFLESSESIKSIQDFPDGFKEAIPMALAKGRKLNQKSLKQIFEKNVGPNKESALEEVFSRVADTFLASTFLKANHQMQSLNHQDVIRLLSLMMKLNKHREKIPHEVIEEHFDMPILLPGCFYKLNPCSKKLEKEGTFEMEYEEVKKQDVPPDISDSRGKGPNDDGTLPPNKKKDCGCEEEEMDKDCECMPKEDCVDQNPCCATITPYMIDLMIVKEKTKCYEAGDMSYIENVMAGETRVRKHRHLERIEEYTEKETSASSYEERDHQVDEQYAIKKETAKTIQQDFSASAGVTFNKKYGVQAGEVSVGSSTSIAGSFNSSFANSRTEAHKTAKDYAKDVVDRSVSKVENKMRELATRRRIIENEERNKHAFENTSADNFSGQYFYVNKVSEAQMFNYDRRMVCDILVPEPAKLYTRLLNSGFKLKEPEKPCCNWKDLDEEQIDKLICQYGLHDIEPLPERTKYVLYNVRGEHGTDKKGNAGAHSGATGFSVPENYIATNLTVSGSTIDWDDSGGGVSIVITVAGKDIVFRDPANNVTSVALPNLEGSQVVNFRAWDATYYDISVSVKCTLNSEFINKWNREFCKEVRAAYAEQLTHYNDEKADFERGKSAIHNRNTFINREIERRELKRMAISYISCQFFDQMNAMKNKVKPCGYPQMDLEETQKEGRFVQFFEQCFEWQHMTYLFYDYFWANKSSWPEKINESASDLIFEKFLRSGFAKLQVVVRPGYEFQLAHFLTFGEIWQGNDAPPIPSDPFYLGLAAEIREQKGNFNVDRKGFVKHDTNLALALATNEICMSANNIDYWDLTIPTSPVFDSVAAGKDLNREIFINAEAYRIMDIRDASGKVIIRLDREFKEEKDKDYDWSTGALYVGSVWNFRTPSKLTWLRDGIDNCLPCYPVPCKNETV